MDDELYVAAEGCKHGNRWESVKLIEAFAAVQKPKRRDRVLQRRGQMSSRDQGETRQGFASCTTATALGWQLTFPRCKSVPRPRKPKSKPPPLQSCFGVEGLLWVFRRHLIRVEGLDWHCAAVCCPLREPPKLCPSFTVDTVRDIFFNGWTVPISAPPVAPVADHSALLVSFLDPYRRSVTGLLATRAPKIGPLGNFPDFASFSCF